MKVLCQWLILIDGNVLRTRLFRREIAKKFNNCLDEILFELPGRYFIKKKVMRVSGYQASLPQINGITAENPAGIFSVYGNYMVQHVDV